MERKKLLFVLFVFSFLFSSGYVFADEVFDLGEVVVTGKSEVISQVATVETIDKEEMELNDADDVASALDNMTGLAISIGTRNEAYINVRGFNEKYVPVFYDGIPWYIPNDGYVDPGEISTGNIARITLSKGAASTLYGANTMGGVINIVTLKPTKAFEGSLSFNGTKDLYRASLNVGSMLGKFYFMGGYSGLDYDNYRMSDDYVALSGSAEDGYKRDNSERKSTTANLKIGYTPAEGQEFAIGFHTTDSEKGWPPSADPDERVRYRKFPEWEKSTYYFIGDTRLHENLTAKIRLFHDYYKNILDAYDDATYTTQDARYAFHSTYDDYSNGASVVLRTDIIDKNVMSLSYHIKNDWHDEQDDYSEDWESYKTEIVSLGVEDAFTMSDQISLVFGVNYDEQKAKKNNGDDLRPDDDSWNGVIGINYDFTEKSRFHASAAKKTRFPTQKELYSSYSGSNLPNPNLRKEESMNYEVGISSAIPYESNVGFTVFYSDVTDLIVEKEVWVEEEDDYLDYNDNIGESSFKGVEFSFGTTYFAKNDIQVAYSYVDAQNETPGALDDSLPEVPKHQLRITDKVQVTDRLSLFGKLRYESGQKEGEDDSWEELDDYWLFDIKGIFNVNDHLQFNLSVQNAFDENYCTSIGFPREGRSIWAGFKTTW